MEIQQEGKESLTAYFYHFKREAKRCNFTNNAATIRIFVKELKNAHNSQIYEKGPQNLADAISEVEKFQAAQNLQPHWHHPQQWISCLTRKITVFSARNIAHYCPNVQCFECDEYGHIVVDCPHRIPPSGTPGHHHRPQSQNSHHNRSTSHHHHKNRYRYSRSLSQSHQYRYPSKSHHDSYRSHPVHITGMTDDITGVVHDAHTQVLVHIILTLTLHTADHLHIGALQLTQETAADHTLNQPINHLRRAHTKFYHNLDDHKLKHILKGIHALQ